MPRARARCAALTAIEGAGRPWSGRSRCACHGAGPSSSNRRRASGDERRDTPMTPRAPDDRVAPPPFPRCSCWLRAAPTSRAALRPDPAHLAARGARPSPRARGAARPRPRRRGRGGCARRSASRPDRAATPCTARGRLGREALALAARGDDPGERRAATPRRRRSSPGRCPPARASRGRGRPSSASPGRRRATGPRPAARSARAARSSLAGSPPVKACSAGSSSTGASSRACSGRSGSSTSRGVVSASARGQGAAAVTPARARSRRPSTGPLARVTLPSTRMSCRR